jgi:predicted  nucleic acid-binding Zn-ribbon protein
MLEADELESHLDQARSSFEEKRLTIEAQKQEIEAFIVNSELELDGLRSSMAELEDGLPPGFLERYRRIAAVRGGVALASVSNHSCEACHVRLRPQLVAEIRANREIIVCENCHRILYYPPSN